MPLSLVVLEAGQERTGDRANDRPLAGVVLITRGEQVVLESATGMADRESSRPITPDTSFVVGSPTKQLAAALVLLEVDRGVLDLGGPVSRHLPELREAWAETATLRQLLDHTSGVPDEPGAPGAPPGTSFRYSNRGYGLVGSILERATGKPFDELLVGLFRRCGMTSASILGQGSGAIAVGYAERPEGGLVRADFRPDEVIPPAGGLIATAGDLVRWNRCLHREHLLSDASYHAMLEARARREHRWGELGYGLGIQRSEENGVLELSHSGYVPGFISTLIYYPDFDVSVVILENTAWRTDDITRVFRPHDDIRRVLRDTVLGTH